MTDVSIKDAGSPALAQTLLEKLTEIANAKVGGTMPTCLRAPTVWHGDVVPLEGGGHIGLASNNWGPQLSALAQEARDEIVRLKLAYDTALDEIAARAFWRPLETAPVPPFDRARAHYAFRCLLQSKSGYVFEGNAHYVQLSRARDAPMTLRWYDARDRLCNPLPILWMPLPAPRSE